MISREKFFEDRRRSVYKWRIDRLSRGLCGACGQGPLVSQTRCQRCAEKHRVRQRLVRQSESEKAKRCAREQVRRAVRSGQIVKPESCQRCNRPSERIHAHHHDYTKRLEIEWLCHVCHAASHRVA